MCKLGSFIPSYLSVRYEDFVAHPVPTIAKIYKFMEIPFTEAHRNAVEESVEWAAIISLCHIQFLNMKLLLNK